jgi:hypothetical protein
MPIDAQRVWPLVILVHNQNAPRASGHALIAVGTPVTGRPRTDPSEPDSGTGLLPGVCDSEAHIWPGMKDARLREPVP